MAKIDDYYATIANKIHAIKEEYPSIKDKPDDYVFSALAVKATYYKNPALSLSDSDIDDIVVDGKGDGGTDILLSDPNSETSDLIIGQSKYYQTITADDVFNAITKMVTFYNDMRLGHYEQVNAKVQSRYINLNSEIGDESKIHFVFFTSANRNGIRANSLERKFKNLIGDQENVDLIVQFADDIVESIKELESRRPTIESGKIKIDIANNCLWYEEDAAIVNVSAFSVKSLYAQHGNNILARNLRYHIPGKTIDQGIEKTIRDEPESFWFKNNGLTIICDDFCVDGTEVKLKNFSIVNGGQTTYMIHKSNYVNEKEDFYLPCKIIKTAGVTEDDKAKFSLEIAKATNSQKAIKEIDLKANSSEQVRFSREMRQAGIFYQTKRGEKIPKEFKEPYLNSDLADIGKLCLAAIFQMPGTSRNKPSTLYKSPFYETVFESNPKQIADLSKELLYIDYYFRKDFMRKYDNKIKNLPERIENISFARNARTICIAFTMLASRYYNNNISSDDLKVIFRGIGDSDIYKSNLLEICKNLNNVNSILPKALFQNKEEYEKVLDELFELIIDRGYTVYTIHRDANDDALNPSNYLKRDQNYYEILKSNWRNFDSEIQIIFSLIIK